MVYSSKLKKEVGPVFVEQQGRQLLHWGNPCVSEDQKDEVGLMQTPPEAKYHTAIMNDANSGNMIAGKDFFLK